MDRTHLKQLLEICFTAKHVIETLPELPKGLKPRHIHVLEAVSDILGEQDLCKVSDVSTKMNITPPSISKLIRELDEKGMLQKRPDNTDRRITYIELTDMGNSCLKRYVTDLHAEWIANLEDVSNESSEITVRTIERLFQEMPGGKRTYDR